MLPSQPFKPRNSAGGRLFFLKLFSAFHLTIVFIQRKKYLTLEQEKVTVCRRPATICGILGLADAPVAGKSNFTDFMDLASKFSSNSITTRIQINCAKNTFNNATKTK